MYFIKKLLLTIKSKISIFIFKFVTCPPVVPEADPPLAEGESVFRKTIK